MAQIPTSLDVILLALQPMLASRLQWGTERVLLVDPAKLTFHPHGDGYLCMWPDTETPVIPILEGAGRLDCRMTERLLINVRTRLGTDEATSSASWLTDQTLGHIASARGPVWDVMIDCIPLDANGNQLVVCPITPAVGGRPRLDAEEKEWGESALAFDVTYQLQLTRNYQ